jgi:nucleoside 2-deoxyribosyltransferase
MSDLKIYFAGSIRGGRADAELYQKIIDNIKKYGEVLTEHVGDDNVLNNGEKNKSDKYIHDRDLEWVKKSDLMIAEVSTPSLGVGYEIAMAIQLKKPVFCFYKVNSGKRLSAMINGSENVKIFEYYNLKDIERSLSEIFIQ